MLTAKSDIITRLRREILPLEGLYTPRNETVDDTGLGFMAAAFPNRTFPLGAVHELISEKGESAAATAGFTAGILSGLMKNGSAAVWIGQSRILFPPALKAYGIQPDQIIFIDLQKEKDILWSMEEALKCGGLAAVIGELPDTQFYIVKKISAGSGTIQGHRFHPSFQPAQPAPEFLHRAMEDQIPPGFF